MPDTADEFAQKTISASLRLLKSMVKLAQDARSRARSADAARAQAAEMRSAIENGFDRGLASAYANMPDDVETDAAPGAGDPVIEFTTKEGNPKGDILGEWLEDAQIPYDRPVPAEAPCALYEVHDTKAAEAALDGAGIGHGQVGDVRHGCIDVDAKAAKRAERALREAHVGFRARGREDGLARFRVAEVNLDNACSMIDGAIAADIRGIDAGRFPNLEDLHARAGMDIPPAACASIAEAIDAAGRIAQEEARRRSEAEKRNQSNPDTVYDSRMDAIEAELRGRTIYCYPRSEYELDLAESACAENGVGFRRAAEVKADVDGVEVAHYAAAINEADLVRALASAPQAQADNLAACLEEIDDGALSRYEIISTATAEALAAKGRACEAAAEKEAARPAAEPPEPVTAKFVTKEFDPDGQILRDWLDEAGVDFEARELRPAAGGDGLLEMTFPPSDAVAGVSTMQAMADAGADGKINGMGTHRFPDLGEAWERAGAAQPAPADGKTNEEEADATPEEEAEPEHAPQAAPHTPGSALVGADAETEEEAALVSDALMANGVYFEKSQDAPLHFDVSAESLASLSEGGRAPSVEDFVEAVADGRVPSGRVAVGSTATASKPARASKRPGSAERKPRRASEILEHARAAAHEISRRGGAPARTASKSTERGARQ